MWRSLYCVRKTKQGSGGNRDPRNGGSDRISGQGGRLWSHPQASGSPKPKSDSRPTGGFQKATGKRSNCSRGRNR